jgi:type IV pilus assembly protein PilA
MFCARCGQGMPEGATLCAACGQQTSLANSSLGGLPLPSSSRPEPVAPQKTSGMAIASLIFGFFFVFFPLSIPAIVFGHIALSQIKRSAGRLGGRGLAIAGLVMGYLGIAMIPLILIIAAIAIPNLLRARIAANEGMAAARVRSINNAQVTYRATYPVIGYARDLASLGGAEPCTPSQATACLVENRIAVATASPGLHGYVFGMILSDTGTQYVVTAVPAVPNQTGRRNFCSTEDGVVRVDPSGSATLDHDTCVTLAPVR